MKYKLLFFVDYYLPGYKAGGPVTSIANLVDFLGDKANIKIITRDHDLGDNIPYKGKRTVFTGKATINYLPKKDCSFKRLLKTIQHSNPNVIYLNSVFSWVFSIKILVIRKLKRLSAVCFVLAPRGELSVGALALKAGRKKAFLFLSKLIGLYKGVKFQATSTQELDDIRRIFGQKAQVSFAKDLSKPPPDCPCLSVKQHGLRIVFFSRIAPMKNLSYVIDCLSFFKKNGELIFLDIYGPTEDKKYWNKCVNMFKQLSNNVTVNYLGALCPTKVHETLKKYDLFFLPTLGENHGHVIYESLAASCPVLISDRTPWRNLEKLNVGWDISLDNKEYFISVLRKLIPMTEIDFSKYRHSCLAYAKKVATDLENLKANQMLFFQE